MLLLQRGLRIAYLAPGRYPRFLAGGLTVHLLVQSILIIAGNIRLLPLTGVTLPFISYGGSSLLTAFFSLAILLIISSENGRHAQSVESSAPNPQPILNLGMALLVLIALAAAALARLAIFSSPELLARQDNARPTIADVYVARGRILDRHGRAPRRKMVANLAASSAVTPLRSTVRRWGTRMYSLGRLVWRPAWIRFFVEQMRELRA